MDVILINGNNEDIESRKYIHIYLFVDLLLSVCHMPDLA